MLDNIHSYEFIDLCLAFMAGKCRLDLYIASVAVTFYEGKCIKVSKAKMY